MKKPRLEDIEGGESRFPHHNSVQVILLLCQFPKFGPSGPGSVEKRLGKEPWAPQGWGCGSPPREGLHSCPVPSSFLLALRTDHLISTHLFPASSHFWEGSQAPNHKTLICKSCIWSLFFKEREGENTHHSPSALLNEGHQPE